MNSDQSTEIKHLKDVKTVMSFDYGTTSIGSAIGQIITGQATPLKAFKANDGVPNWKEVEELLKEWQPDLIVVGLPLNMDGSEQPLTLRAKTFANRIAGRFNLNVVLQDERLTSVEAKARLFDSKGFKGLKKQKIDSTAAVIILESWFEGNGY